MLHYYAPSKILAKVFSYKKSKNPDIQTAFFIYLSVLYYNKVSLSYIFLIITKLITYNQTPNFEI